MPLSLAVGNAVFADDKDHEEKLPELANHWRVPTIFDRALAVVTRNRCLRDLLVVELADNDSITAHNVNFFCIVKNAAVSRARHDVLA